MPYLQPNVTYTGNSQGLYVPMGSGNVIPEAVTFAGEVTFDGGVTLNDNPLTAVGQDVIVTEGASLVAIDGNCRVLASATTQELAYIDMTGNTDSGPVTRLAVGGGSAVAPFETYKFGIYATAGGASPFVEALTVDDSAVVKIAGKPVASPSRVALVGVVGNSITVPASTPSQSITASIPFLENHTYRVSVSCQLDNNDVTPLVLTSLAIGGVLMGQQSSNIPVQSAMYSCIFKPTANESNPVVASNGSATTSSFIQFNAKCEFVLVEDLGVF